MIIRDGTANGAVKRSLALYFARVWDTGTDAIALPALAAILPESDSPRHENFRNDLLGIQQDESFAPLRVLRSEWLAHRILESNDRKRFERENPVGDVTMNNLIRLTEKSILLVGELCFLTNGQSNNYSGRIQKAERYCREFWQVIPVLGEIESTFFKPVNDL